MFFVFNINEYLLNENNGKMSTYASHTYENEQN